MATAFAQIQAQLKAALLAQPAIAGARVYTSWRRPIQDGVDSAVVIRRPGTRGQQPMLRALDWATRFEIDCYAKDKAQTPAEDRVDELVAAVWQRLQGLPLPALDVQGIAMDAEIAWDQDEADATVSLATLSLTVQHRTHKHQLTPISLP